MYSSIEKEDREEVIRKCYWPIFNLVDIGVPIGIEATGLTLEIINSLDRTWINTLRKHIISNKIEFIGSGYSQIIGPLVPNEVNSWNQKIGKKVYSKLLNCDPIIALVNEMAYSAGVVEHYSNNGYKAIVMEWNNPRKYNPKWKNEWRYFPQIAIGSRNVSANLIWADSVIFQKFQQYVHGEYSLQKYIEYLKNIDCKNRRFLPLYSNDVEIFDYRPGRYHNEPVLDTISEWKRIIDLYSRLSGEEWAEFVYPTDVIETKPSEHSYNEIQIDWFKHGSALNKIASVNK